MTVDPGPSDPVLISNQPDPPRPQPDAGNIFVGPNGLRAGWRLLIFLAIFVGAFELCRIRALTHPCRSSVSADPTQRRAYARRAN